VVFKKKKGLGSNLDRATGRCKWGGGGGGEGRKGAKAWNISRKGGQTIRVMVEKKKKKGEGEEC